MEPTEQTRFILDEEHWEEFKNALNSPSRELPALKKLEPSVFEEKQILDGYKDISEGRYFKSSGDYKSDLKEFKNKEENGW